MVYRSEMSSTTDDLDSSVDVSWCVSTDLMHKYAWCIPFLMYGTDFDGFMPFKREPRRARVGWTTM